MRGKEGKVIWHVEHRHLSGISMHASLETDPKGQAVPKGQKSGKTFRLVWIEWDKPPEVIAIRLSLKEQADLAKALRWKEKRK